MAQVSMNIAQAFHKSAVTVKILRDMLSHREMSAFFCFLGIWHVSLTTLSFIQYKGYSGSPPSWIISLNGYTYIFAFVVMLNHCLA